MQTDSKQTQHNTQRTTNTEQQKTIITTNIKNQTVKLTKNTYKIVCRLLGPQNNNAILQ